MSLTYFIFSRFREINSNSGFFSFNYFLSIFLISTSIIGLILTDSITSGYKTSLYNKARSFGSDYKVIDVNSKFISMSDYLGLSKNLDRINSINPDCNIPSTIVLMLCLHL